MSVCMCLYIYHLIISSWLILISCNTLQLYTYTILTINLYVPLVPVGRWWLCCRGDRLTMWAWQVWVWGVLQQQNVMGGSWLLRFGWLLRTQDACQTIGSCSRQVLTRCCILFWAKFLSNWLDLIRIRIVHSKPIALETRLKIDSAWLVLGRLKVKPVIRQALRGGNPQVPEHDNSPLSFDVVRFQRSLNLIPIQSQVIWEWWFCSCSPSPFSSKHSIDSYVSWWLIILTCCLFMFFSQSDWVLSIRSADSSGCSYHCWSPGCILKRRKSAVAKSGGLIMQCQCHQNK